MKSKQQIKEDFGYKKLGKLKDGIYIAKDKNKKFFHVNLDGEPIYPHKFDKLTKFKKGIAIACYGKEYFHIDLHGNPLYNKKYNRVREFINGYAVVCTSSTESEKLREYLIDTAGNIVAGPFLRIHDDFTSNSPHHYGYIKVDNDDHSSNYLDIELKPVLPKLMKIRTIDFSNMIMLAKEISVDDRHKIYSFPDCIKLFEDDIYSIEKINSNLLLVKTLNNDIDFSKCLINNKGERLTEYYEDLEKVKYPKNINVVRLLSDADIKFIGTRRITEEIEGKKKVKRIHVLLDKDLKEIIIGS